MNRSDEDWQGRHTTMHGMADIIARNHTVVLLTCSISFFLGWVAGGGVEEDQGWVHVFVGAVFAFLGLAFLFFPGGWPLWLLPKSYRKRRRFGFGDSFQYHETLGIGPEASREEMKKAYRNLVEQWRPDRFNDDPKMQELAIQMMKEMNQAYDWLESNVYGKRTR